MVDRPDLSAPEAREAEPTGLFPPSGVHGYGRHVIVLVAIPVVLILGWLVLRGRHLDA